VKELGYLEKSHPSIRIQLKKVKLAEQKGICPLCNEDLPQKYTELDRFSANAGYTKENTRLVHRQCHLDHHAKNGWK
jgi:hypothetical protein